MADPTHGNGSENPESGGGSDSDAQYMTPEQFNRAFSNRAKQLQTNVVKSITETVNSIIEEKLSAFGNTRQEPTVENDSNDPPTSSSGDLPPEVANMMKSMKSRLSKLENDNKSLREQRDQERQQASREKMRTATRDALSELGIQGTHGSHAVGHLIDVTKAVRLSSDGEPVYFNGEFEQSLSEGLEEWSKSESAALYRPAKPDTGSGERKSVNVQAPIQGDDPRSAALRAIQNEMM